MPVYSAKHRLFGITRYKVANVLWNEHKEFDADINMISK